MGTGSQQENVSRMKIHWQGPGVKPTVQGSATLRRWGGGAGLAAVWETRCTPVMWREPTALTPRPLGTAVCAPERIRVVGAGRAVSVEDLDS